MDSSDRPSLIEYPCEFPIKIIGRVASTDTASPSELEQARQEFTRTILEIVKFHAPDFDDVNLEARISKKNSYLSLTCTIFATSRAQLDSLYRDLSGHPLVVMVL
jgi:putative lipoic acid-binding regulatory protein